MTHKKTSLLTPEEMLERQQIILDLIQNGQDLQPIESLWPDYYETALKTEQLDPFVRNVMDVLKHTDTEFYNGMTKRNRERYDRHLNHLNYQKNLNAGHTYRPQSWGHPTPTYKKR